MEDFFVRSLLAGIAISIVAGPVGSVMLWRRQAFFGAALSHSAVLGVALGLLLGVSPFWATLATVLVLAVLIERVFHIPKLAHDTIVGVIGHGSLAAALVVMAFLQNIRIDLMAYLFGDVLAIGKSELWFTAAFAALICLVMVALWRNLVSATATPDIAEAEGVPVRLLSLVYALILALVIAIGIQLVGALLIVALLMIPAAAARPFVSSPAAMAILASILAAISSVGGLCASLWLDWPAGPAIAMVAVVFFAGATAFERLRP